MHAVFLSYAARSVELEYHRIFFHQLPEISTMSSRLLPKRYLRKITHSQRRWERKRVKAFSRSIDPETPFRYHSPHLLFFGFSASISPSYSEISIFFSLPLSSFSSPFLLLHILLPSFFSFSQMPFRNLPDYSSAAFRLHFLEEPSEPSLATPWCGEGREAE